MKYIFNIKQSVIVKWKLTMNEVLILYYLIGFYDSDNCLYKNLDDRKYMWICYTKVASDLPCLYIGKRRWQQIVNKLCDKGFLDKRVLEDKTYIYINKKRLELL